jgi:hypothetical protein
MTWWRVAAERAEGFPEPVVTRAGPAWQLWLAVGLDALGGSEIYAVFRRNSNGSVASYAQYLGSRRC